MIVAWVIGLSVAQARALHTAIEAEGDNPGTTEVRRRGRRSRSDPARVTPRLALERTPVGVDVGVPDDAWSELRLLLLDPTLVLTRSRTPPQLPLTARS